MIAFEDFSCGNKIDGIELLEEFCEVGRANLEKVGHGGHITCTDSLEFKGYDAYELFYMYDPFRGTTFEGAIKKLEESYRCNPREMVLLYADPWEHKAVVKDGVFRLEKQIISDWATRMVNVYITGHS